MTSSDFICELEKRGKWEVWHAFYGIVTVTDVRRESFCWRLGSVGGELLFYSEKWQFPGIAPADSFEEWVGKWINRVGGLNQEHSGVPFAQWDFVCQLLRAYRRGDSP